MSSTDIVKKIDRGSADWWITRIEKACEAKKKHGYENRWDDIDLYYTHQAFKPIYPAFNLIYIHGRSLLPSLIFRTPRITISPRLPGSLPWAMILESVDNWLVGEMEIKDVLIKSALHAFLYNMGAVQTGFDFSDKPEDHMRLNQVTGIVDRARHYNFPFFDLIHPKYLILDPLAKTQRVCRWFGKILTIPTESLKEMAKEDKNIIKSECTATHASGKTSASDQKLINEASAIEDYTQFYEVHNAESGEWFWLKPDGGFIMKPTEDPLQVDGLPLDLLSYNQNPNSLWGTPDAIYIESQMLDGNDTRMAALRQRRIATLKGIVDETLISKEELEKFYETSTMPFIRVQNLPVGKSINDAIALLQPHVPMDLLQYEQAILKDSQLTLGFGPNQLGDFAPGRRSKYEAQTVEEHNQIRVSERREMVRDMTVSLFRKVNQLVLKNWKAPMVKQVVGVDGALYWVKFVPSEVQNLRAELNVSVDTESMMPQSTERVKEEMKMVLDTLTRVQGINVVPLIRQLLSKFSWADVNSYLPQAPQAQEMPAQEFADRQSKMIGPGGVNGQTVANNVRGLGNALL